MINFKFFQRKRLISYRNVPVFYTTESNGKSFAMLRFAERDQTENNEDVKIFHGTFMGFRRMVNNHPILDWDYNKPVIHLVAYYSKRYSNCQRLAYIDYFRESLRRFGKNQKLKIFYESI